MALNTGGSWESQISHAHTHTHTYGILFAFHIGRHFAVCRESSMHSFDCKIKFKKLKFHPMRIDFHEFGFHVRSHDSNHFEEQIIPFTQ